MQFNDSELRFLVKTLRRRSRNRYTLFVFALFPIGFWVALWHYQVFPMLQNVLVGFIAASVWFTWAFMDARDKQDKLITLLLRFVNADPEALEQLSAKRGLGDLQ